VLAMTWEIRDHLENYEQYWADSLAGLGNAAHRGRIAPHQIKRYAIIDDIGFTMVFDPVICLPNYSLMGAYYRNSMRWLFDPDVELEECQMGRNEVFTELDRSGIKIVP